MRTLTGILSYNINAETEHGIFMSAKRCLIYEAWEVLYENSHLLKQYQLRFLDYFRNEDNLFWAKDAEINDIFALLYILSKHSNLRSSAKVSIAEIEEALPSISENKAFIEIPLSEALPFISLARTTSLSIPESGVSFQCLSGLEVHPFLWGFEANRQFSIKLLSDDLIEDNAGYYLPVDSQEFADFAQDFLQVKVFPERSLRVLEHSQSQIQA